VLNEVSSAPNIGIDRLNVSVSTAVALRLHSSTICLPVVKPKTRELAEWAKDDSMNINLKKSCGSLNSSADW
jgi:hypothetical protein